MEVNLLCTTTGERCWNVHVLQRYARMMTEHESTYTKEHGELIMQPGEINCEGVVENIYGLGKVCLPFIEPSLIVYQYAVLELPENVRCMREIKGFRLIKPDGSPWHRKLDL